MAGVDTPDNTRGVVSAQVQLGIIPPGETSIIVGIPPNAETIVVAGPQWDAARNLVVCAGVTTGISYPIAYIGGYGEGGSTTAYVDVSSAYDEQVQIAFSVPNNNGVYVYADTAAHISTDPSRLASNLGASYVIPTPPSTDPGDHPPTELRIVAWAFNGSGTVLIAPGPGIRYRLFEATLAPYNGSGQFGSLACGGALLYTNFLGQAQVDCRPSGVPLAANTAITWTRSDGAGEYMTGTVVYTIEDV